MLQENGIQGVELVFLALLFFVVLFAILARKLRTPYPIMLVVAGLFLSLVPGIPHIVLNPDVVFLVILPPLLYSAAWLTSWREFKFNIVSVFLLAFGLVGFTAVGVGYLARWVFPGFDWTLGFVLGAVIATTDSIAATSIAKRIGLPQRIVDVLEAESLVNDASGLLALEFAVGMVVSGHSPSLAAGALRLMYLTVAGIAVGLFIGLIIEWFEKHIDDGPIEIVVSILSPYALYLAAEAIHASGVLAVVACGLYLSRRSSQFFSPTVRLQAWAVWESLTFTINGLAFVLIGLQLPYVLAGIHRFTFRQLTGYGILFSVMVIVLRLIWIFPAAYGAQFIRSRLLHQSNPKLDPKQVFIVGWTGMRGVVALAAAMALPETLDSGLPFPGRNLIVFLTFCVIFVTLVLQGLTLPALIRVLGLSGKSGNECEEEEARRTIAGTALTYLQSARGADLPEFSAVYDDVSKRYARRLASLGGQKDENPAMNNKQLGRYRSLMAELLREERKTAIGLRNEGRMSDEVLRKIEHELDLSETRLELS